MRVIAGSARGCKLTAAPGFHTRPTTDRIKETIFNILAPNINGAIILDLFSGTGAFGIEALSRGADYAVLVEWDKQCAEVAAGNLKTARLAERAELLRMDAFIALRQLGEGRKMNGRLFDLVFLDPPYGQGQIEAALQEILAQGLLKDTGIIMAEQGGSEDIITPKLLEAYKIKQYKTTKLVFYRMKTDPIHATGEAL